MNNPRLLTTFTLATISLGGTVAPASDGHRQVFLLGGQSNMVGVGPIALAAEVDPYRNPLPEVLLNYGVSNGEPEELPVNEWIALAPGSGRDFGPELTFGHTLRQVDPSGDYALIKHALGGSNVSVDWNPTVEDNVYSDFRSTVEVALQDLTDAGDTYDIVGMLWVQGISDGIGGSSASEYQTNLERLIADVRLRYQPDLPVFIARTSIKQTQAGNSPEGGRGGAVTGLAAIRLGQENVALNDPLAFLIDTDDFGTDSLHYTTSGQIDLGKALAESYFKNVAVPEPGTLGITIALLLFAGRSLGRRNDHHTHSRTIR